MLGDYEVFKQEFYQLADIDLSSYKEGQMKRRIDNFISKHGADDYIQFFSLLKKDKNILADFITYLTINVSEFYRNPNQWHTLETMVVPELVKRKERPIRIWSAACSTGDEPYTLAMVFSDFIPLEQFEIVATDLDIEVLKKAMCGEYSEKSLKGLPKHYIDKFMEKSGSGTYVVSDKLKSRIEFKQHNLLKDEYPKDLDLIVCRNVLIYFTKQAKEEIYQKFSDSLKRDSYLFIGSTEQIISSMDYGLKNSQSFFYKKEK